ncbi:MAG: hypothetical protein ABJO38_05970, partial [Stappiaceae bacterium]
MRHDSTAFPDGQVLPPYAETGLSNFFKRVRPMFDTFRDNGHKPGLKRGISAALGLLLLATTPVLTAAPSMAQADKATNFILKDNGLLKKDGTDGPKKLEPAPGGGAGGGGGGGGGGG